MALQTCLLWSYRAWVLYHYLYYASFLLMLL